MNAVLDVLKLRRVKLDYISPPICQVILSGSGSSLMLEAVFGPEPPANLAFGGQCERFLTWTNPRGAACVTLYKAVDPNDPVTQYRSITDCVPVGYASVCSPGWWKYATFTEDGQASALSAPIYVPGGSHVDFQIIQQQGAVRYELYKNHNPTNPNAEYRLVASGINFHTIEVCEASGCYRAQVITDDGPSNLSNPICRTSEEDCCPAPGCPLGYYWDGVLCSCVPGNLISDVICPLPSACIGEPYSSELVVLGGASPFLWELVSGAVPTGMNLHTGLFSGSTAPIDGTPTVGGSYTFTVICTSDDGSDFTRSCTINVLALAQGSTLPDATTDTLYSQQLTGVGGVAPFSFDLASGSFPTGVTMDAAGLVSGTPVYGETTAAVIGLTDADGHRCEVPLSVQVNGCPAVSTYPTTTIVGENINTVAGGALDRERRIMWVMEGGFKAAAPHQIIHLVDTSTISYLGTATDSGNLINSAAKGDSFRAVIIDSKYDQCIAGGGQGYLSYYDLDSKDCLAVPAPQFGLVELPPEYMTYDASRGYVYRLVPYLGGVLNLSILDCARSVRAVIHNTGSVAGRTYGAKYSPGADMVYMSNPDGPNLLHKWDPNTLLFSTNVGPASGGDNAKYISWVRELDLILIFTAGGNTHVIDPNAGDAIIATIGFSGVNGISEATDYNDCNGKVYISGISGSSKIQLLDPAAGWTRVAVPGVGLNEFYLFQFDQYSNRLFTHDRGTGVVHTYA